MSFKIHHISNYVIFKSIFNETLGAHHISKSLIKKTPNIFITGFPKVTLKELWNHHASILKDWHWQYFQRLLFCVKLNNIYICSATKISKLSNWNWSQQKWDPENVSHEEWDSRGWDDGRGWRSGFVPFVSSLFSLHSGSHTGETLWV